MTMKLSLVLCCTALLAAGCSSSPSDTSGDAGHADSALASDGSPGHEAGFDSPPEATTEDAEMEAAVVCTTLANSAAAVPVQTFAADPPTPEGGTIVDGTYEMTGAAIYTGPDGPSGTNGTSQTTIQITGSTIQIVNAGDPPTRTITLATSGTSFTSTDTCPDYSTVIQGSYTATATTFVVQFPGGTDDAGARTVVESFVLK
jgi:hypothetical protein